MNPHELAHASPQELSSLFHNSLIKKDENGLRDAFTELESRFLSAFASIDGSGQFVDAYLPLSGLPDVASFHIRDPLMRYVNRLEYLLDLAGERSRSVTTGDVMRQIVKSRKRGSDLIRELAGAPSEGIALEELRAKMAITAQNLSPLITDFHASGIIQREKCGKSVFVTLTPEGRSLLGASESTPQVTVANPFGMKLMKKPAQQAFKAA
jgi:DNA-binding MarR family transcriptional regulator